MRTGSLNGNRERHTATLLQDGSVLVAGGWSFDFGSIAEAEVYHPSRTIPPPALLSLSGDGRGSVAVLHASTQQVISPSNPTAAGEVLEIYATGLLNASVVPPLVSIGAGGMFSQARYNEAPMRKPILAFAIAVPCFAQAPLVKGVGNFIHNVADLNQSVHFYKDVLGMEIPRPAGDWQTTDGVLKMYGALGGKFRVANAQVTGVAMRVELVEFQGVDRRPVRRSIGEPGASLLFLTAPDLQPVLGRLKAAGWPLAVNLTTGCNGRGIAVADPDGFSVLVLERQGGTPAADGKNFTDLRFGYTVSSDAILNGPFKALKLGGSPLMSPCRTVEESMLKSRATAVKLPDGFEIMLVPSEAGKRLSGATRPQDPGAAVLRLAVVEAETAVRALSQAGVKVVSEGGVIQTLPPAGLKATILAAPDNLFIQVVQ